MSTLRFPLKTGKLLGCLRIGNENGPVAAQRDTGGAGRQFPLIGRRLELQRRIVADRDIGKASGKIDRHDRTAQPSAVAARRHHQLDKRRIGIATAVDEIGDIFQIADQ